jgi:hypothetical protein
MKAILQWVLRTMMKDQTGVMRTLPKKDLVDFNVAMTAERLMRNGIDPNSLKNANQVENAINQIEAPRNVQQGIKSTKSAKIFDLEGKEIDPKKGIMGGKQIPDDDLPPPGSRGGPDDIAAPVMDVEDMGEGFIEFVRKTDPEAAAKLQKEEDRIKAAIEAANKRAAKNLKNKKKKKDKDPEDMAQGGRAGFKEGSKMTRRSFLKILGGLAAVPIVGKFFKLAKVGKTMKEVPMIKTDNVPGKPEWFDALVNKVIVEGDDVTKKFATGERQSIHQKTLDDGSVVRVTEDVDDGAVRVEYESVDNMYEDPVQLQYKKPLPDEGDPNPSAEFTTAESGPVGRAFGPDDYEIEIDEIGGTSISDLTSDVSKLKQYATGKKPTLKEIVQTKKRKDRAKAISEGGENEMDEVIRRQGDYVQFDDIYPEQDFASGGIARMLGE